MLSNSVSPDVANTLEVGFIRRGGKRVILQMLTLASQRVPGRVSGNHRKSNPHGLIKYHCHDEKNSCNSEFCQDLPGHCR